MTLLQAQYDTKPELGTNLYVVKVNLIYIILCGLKFPLLPITVGTFNMKNIFNMCAKSISTENIFRFSFQRMI